MRGLLKLPTASIASCALSVLQVKTRKGGRNMQKFLITIVLFLFSAMAIAQSTNNQTQTTGSTGDNQAQGAQSQDTGGAKGAVSGAAGAVKHGAETGYEKTKEGAQTGYEDTKKGVKIVYGGAKKAVTGSSSDQSAAQEQTGSNQEDTANTSERSTAETTASKSRLPQTASLLPLLGLLGIGSLGFSVWRSRLFRS